MRKLITSLILVGLLGTFCLAADLSGPDKAFLRRLKAGKLPAGSVATADIADNAVTTGKIAAGTIINSDVSATAAIDVTKITFDRLKDDAPGTAPGGTNGTAVALSRILLDLAATGGTNNARNAITFTALAPSFSGRIFGLVNTGTSNSLTLSASGIYKGPAIELDPSEACWIIAPVSNTLYGIGPAFD